MDCAQNGSCSSDALPVCEVSPLLSYSGEGLEAVVHKRSFTSPLHLQPNNNEEEEEKMVNGVDSR
jgi:hypothetical protein